jgi:V/A-type H+-transporting ATPase subunit B
MAGAGIEYRGLSRLHGSLAQLDGVSGVGYREEAEILAPDQRPRPARVLSVAERTVQIEVLAAGEGLSLEECRVRFLGTPLRLGVGPELLGRVFDGLGRPRDGLPRPLAVEERAIEGAPINPCRREVPRDFLETGVSVLDGLNTLVLGQKLPLFSESGLPHDEQARQIIRQARVPGAGIHEFAIVFVALGVPYQTALRYEEDFARSGALSRTVAFLNLADDPTPERVLTPRCALTAAEYLAFDMGLHVLVVLTDLTNYGEALREMSAARGEVPSRKGYPGTLYSDLASIFERAGRIRGRPGSITQIPILTMPGGDLTHPIPDLTGYITEGQIVLDRELHRRGVYPPVNVLPSLSRLMDDGIGPGRTREDHEAVARQLYIACARVARARSLESIIGREDLSEVERTYLAFGERFERLFLTQGREERRTIATTLDRAWEALHTLPDSELGRLPPELVAAHRGPA